MNDLVEISSYSSEGASIASASATLGEHIRTDSAAIARHCLKEIAPVCEDVATIAEAAAFSDRFMTRRRSNRWARRLVVKIPVFERELFERTAVQRALNDTLSFLTGDDWEIAFVSRAQVPSPQRYLPLVNERPRYVIPFSNGLDSFAQAKLLQADHGESAILRVRAGKLRKGDSRIKIPMIEIPRGFRAGHPREKSYRTRPLVYFCFAAIAAVTVRAEAVVIGENGQGSLGPSFARFGNEWPFRSTHPGFVARLQNYLSQVFGSGVRFDQPQLWRTKGQVLTDLKTRGLLDELGQTCSCSLRPLQRRGQHGCGYCGGCLLRRTSFLSAEIAPESFAYDLSEDKLVLSLKSGDEEMPKSQKDVLVRSALSMATFADVLAHSDGNAALGRELRDIPIGRDEDDNTHGANDERLRELVDQHRFEWRSMLGALPERSWLRTQFL